MKEAFQEWLTLMKRKSDKKSTGAVLIVLLKKFHVERQPGSPLRGLAMCKTHWRSILAGIAVFLICTVAAGYKYMAHERCQKMHAMPLGLLPFDVLAPVPICGRWKEHMPRVRDTKAKRMDAAEQMVKCAYLQGHGPAAYDMALEAEIRENFQDALRLYQDGVKFGDKLSAASLFLLFDPSRGAGRIEFLEPIGWITDQERYRRYEEISQALDLNPDLKFGHIDKAVPLPPAELPKWHGIADALDPEAVGPPTY